MSDPKDEKYSEEDLALIYDYLELLGWIEARIEPKTGKTYYRYTKHGIDRVYNEYLRLADRLN